MSYVLKSIVEWLSNIITDMLRAVVALIAQISQPHPYWNDAWAVNAREVIVIGAWSWLTVKIVYEAWRLYIARDAGEAIMPPGLLIRRAIVAAFAIPATGWAVNWVADVSRALTLAIIAKGVEPDLYGWGVSLITALTTTALGLGFGTFLLYAGMVALLVGMCLLVYMQSFVRGVELAVAYIVGPACALSAASNDDPFTTGSLGAFIKEVTILQFVGSLQTALLMGVVQYTLAAGFEIVNVLMSIPIMYVAIRLPTILRGYVYGGGSGGSGGGSHTVIMMATKALAKMPW